MVADGGQGILRPTYADRIGQHAAMKGHSPVAYLGRSDVGSAPVKGRSIDEDQCFFIGQCGRRRVG